tara:strand:+ start:160 stop:384 length:225 start_codon:yes stop_codon:yes gene_type:complete
MSKDIVNQPPHYKNGEIECIDAIRSMLTADEFKAYCKANAVKYIWREDLKGSNIQDLEKAVVYLNWAIERLKNI